MSYSFMKLTGSIEQSIEDRFISDGDLVDMVVEEIRGDDHFAVAFAAVRSREHNNNVGAITYMLKRPTDDDGNDCLVRKIEETGGPFACFCPDRILEQLDPPTNLAAQVWRQKCRSNVGWEAEHWSEDLLID